jgi:hypothetical protein
MSTPGQSFDPNAVASRPNLPPDNTNHSGGEPSITYQELQAANPGQIGLIAASWTNVARR